MLEEFLSRKFLGCLPRLFLWGFVIVLVLVPVRLAWTGLFLLKLRLESVLPPQIATLLVVLLAASILFLGLALLVRFLRRGKATSGAHGTAKWGNGESLKTPRGLPVGRMNNEMLRLDGEGHILTLAPTGAGKTTGAAVPAALTHPGSMVITDIKGELYPITKRRREELGASVVCLDPFGLAGGTDTFNPLDLIDLDSQDYFDDAALIADMLVVDEENKGDATFWNEEAKALLSGLLLYVAAHRPERNLLELRRVLTSPPSDWLEHLAVMEHSDAAGGLVARASARLQQKSDRERSGVVSSAQRFTHFLDSPRMAKALETSSFDPLDLKRHSLSLYLVLPEERISIYRGWLRLLVGSTLLGVTRVPGVPEDRVLFLLDEIAQLGRLERLEKAITLARGYGARLWLLVQDLAQLRSVYPKRWESLLANVELLQAFGTADQQTAELLSRMTGQATVWAHGQSRGRGRSLRVEDPVGSFSGQSGRNLQEIARPLLTPDEVRTLAQDRQLLFRRAEAPVLAEKLFYPTDEEFVSNADPNPTR